MPNVDVAALGGARKLLGFSKRSVEFEQSTVGDLLRSLPTQDGASLYDHLVCEGRLRGDYAVLVNGLSLGPDKLDTRLRGGEQIVTMEILRHLHGG